MDQNNKNNQKRKAKPMIIFQDKYKFSIYTMREEAIGSNDERRNRLSIF